MKKYFLLISISFCIINIIQAQEKDFLVGRIFDENTKNPIPFATVSFVENYMGVISNEDGSFRLFLGSTKEGKTIEINCIGYERKSFSLNDIDFWQIQNIYLHEKSYTIDEAVITKKKKRRPSAAKIVSFAIENIKDNYPIDPLLLNCYYREYLKIENQYVNLFEANVDVEDFGINTLDFEQTKLKLNFGAINHDFEYDSLKIIDYGSPKQKYIPYGNTGYDGGNELAFLRMHDPIRNYQLESFDFIKNLQTDFLHNHSFRLKKIELYDSIPVYCIEFNYIGPEKCEKFATGSSSELIKTAPHIPFKVRGLIYVQSENYLINKLEYEVYITENKNERVLWELNLEYRNYKDKAHLHYISFNNQIEIPNYKNEKYFYLKNLLINRHINNIQLQFNNSVDYNSAQKIKNYDLRILDTALIIKNIKIIDSIVLLEIVDFNKHFDLMKETDLHNFEFKVKNLKDNYGNNLDELESILANQFRELFVNKIIPSFSSIPNDSSLDKYKSMIYYKTLGIIKKQNNFNSPLLE